LERVNTIIGTLISRFQAARELERIDSKVELPLDADIPLIALLLGGGIVHVVVADLRNKVDARGKGDDRRSINDPGIIFRGVNWSILDVGGAVVAAGDG